MRAGALLIAIRKLCMEAETMIQLVTQQGLAVGLTVFLIWFFTKQYSTMTDRMNKTLELLDKCMDKLVK